MSKEQSYDPEYLRSRKEALWILLAWTGCLIWTVSYSAIAGYDVEYDKLKFLFGIPAWVFWGVGMPWIVATAFSIWFSLSVMRDEDTIAVDDEADGEA
jgi:hypothetical protein